MSEEINLDLLNILVGILPDNIILKDMWYYTYIRRFNVLVDVNDNIDVHELKWNNGANTIYCTKKILQEKFDIINLHKKILNKPYRDISDEEKLYLVKYYRIMEKINV